MMPAGCCYLFQAEQRTTRTWSLWLKGTNPGIIHLCRHITPAAIFFPDSFTYQHSVFRSSQLSFTSATSFEFPSTFSSPHSSPLFIKSVIMLPSSLPPPRSQCYWLHYANVTQPRAQSYTADEIRHQHKQPRTTTTTKKTLLFRIIMSTNDDNVDVQKLCRINPASSLLHLSIWWGVA